MSIFPATIDFQESCDPSRPLYFCFDDTVEEDDVPRSLKRRGVDALHMKTRAAEEKHTLYQEMRTVADHLQQQHAFLCSAINDTEQPGAKAVLIQRLQQLERKLHHAATMLHQRVPDVVPATHAYVTPDDPRLSRALPMSAYRHWYTATTMIATRSVSTLDEGRFSASGTNTLSKFVRFVIHN